MRSKDLDPRHHSQAADKTAGNRLRLLDFDDLYLLRHLLEGKTIAATAQQLGLTQPAVTQRMRKIERVFAEPLLAKAGRHVKLTKEGVAVCTKAADALALMHQVTSEPAGASLTIGAAPAIAERWLWPALKEMHRAGPRMLFHCVVGSSDEILGLLDAGGVDACLSAAPQRLGTFGALDVGEDEYVMVASPALAAGVATVEDLKGILLLEIDRSLPLLSRVEAGARAAMRFSDIWFLGAFSSIVAAAQGGFGLGILPRSLVQSQVSAGKLAVVLPSIDVTPEAFYLLFRRERRIEAAMQPLMERLRTKGSAGL